MVLIVLRQLEVAGSNQQMAKLVRVLCLSSGSAKSFHEKAGECQVCSFIFSLFFSSFFFLLCSNCSPGVKPPLSPPFHPHSFFERLSLGASWVYSIQQVLLPDNRPLFPLAKETGPGLSRSHLISAVEAIASSLAFLSFLRSRSPRWTATSDEPSVSITAIDFMPAATAASTVLLPAIMRL